MSEETATGYPVDGVNQVKRRHDRGFYDHATVHTVLDAAAMCHVSYVVDGNPFCTPTLFWREGNRLYGTADYRSVMAFGHARIVEDPEEKRRARYDGGPLLSRPHRATAREHTEGNQCDDRRHDGHREGVGQDPC